MLGTWTISTYHFYFFFGKPKERIFIGSMIKFNAGKAPKDRGFFIWIKIKK